MINSFTVFAMVPARGGSSRIADKNIKELGGKPLISYTFEESKKSKYIDRTILISDSEKIAVIAKSYGVEWPFKEPEKLADGTSPDFDFFLYALEWLEKNEKYIPDIIVQLRPTSPLRIVEEIDRAIELLAKHPEIDSVRTVAEPEQSPYKMYKIGENGLLEPLLTIPGVPESFNLPGQKLPKAYKHVGYVDVMWRKTIVEKKKMTGDKILPLILESAESGINTPEDWQYYEYLIKNKNLGK